MIYAQIKYGVVINTIVLDDEALLPAFRIDADRVMQIDALIPQPSIGWTFNGQHFTPPANVIAIADISPRQIRQALILSGVNLADIDVALDTLPEPQRGLAKTEWEYATIFERNRPLVQQVAEALGWTSEQLDALWTAAADL